MINKKQKLDMKRIKRAVIQNRLYIALALLFFMVSVGGTIAYYFSQHQLTNEFKTADYQVVLTEEFPISEWDDDNTLTKEVKVVNNGTGNVLLRVSYNEFWYENGDIVNNLYNGLEIVTKNWHDDFLNKFEYIDGWYYYNEVLSPNGSVGLLNTIVRNSDVYNETSEYHLDFSYEVVQADSVAANSVWKRQVTIEGSNVVWE